MMFNPVGQNPFELFDVWMKDAEREEPNNPNAMCLSTVASDGKPSSRMVLLKDYDDQGFVFYTNSESRKGGELSENPNVALCLYWKTFQRQVRIEGEVEIVPRDMTQAYFNSRHHGSQIASTASKQSRPLPDRQVYEERIKELEKQFEGVEQIPCPDHWNGYRVKPTSIEFWVEGEFRTHDRFVFRQDENGIWNAERLYP
jgi:pyridoxamine 5'-phosphate oxidase